MAEPVFDPAGFYDLDVATGQLRARGEGPVVALQREELSALLAAAASGDGPEVIGRLGARLGGAVARALGGPAKDRSPEAVAGRVADVLGVFGWGRVVFERWGPALAVRWPDAPVAAGAAASLLGGLIGAVAEREIACVPLADERFLIVSPRIAGTVRAWVAREEADVASVVARLAPTAPEASA